MKTSSGSVDREFFVVMSNGQSIKALFRANMILMWPRGDTDDSSYWVRAAGDGDPIDLEVTEY